MAGKYTNQKQDNEKNKFSPDSEGNTAVNTIDNATKQTIEDILGGTVSTNNTTTTPLLTGETFTGTGENPISSQVGVSLITDQEGVLYFDFSNDGINWDSTFPVNGFRVKAGIHQFHTAVKMPRYFRIRIVNEGSDQTYLRAYTYYGSNFVPSNTPLNQPIGINNDSISVRPSLPEDEIVLGRRQGVSSFTKFGYNSNLTATGGEQVIWEDSGSSFTPMKTADTFQITYNNALDGLGTTGALSLQFTYIDENGISSTAVHTLGSTGTDTTSFSGLGINRIVVFSSGSNEANVGQITVRDTTTLGAQAFIGPEDSVTQQGIFFVDSNSDAIGKLLYFKTNRIKGGGSPIVLVKGYVYSRITSTRYLIYRELINTVTDSNVNITEPVGFKLNPQDVLYFVADTDTNSTELDIRFSIVEYKRT